jgi:hypothetical protein
VLVNNRKRLSAFEAVRTAHELLTTAEQYLDTLSLPTHNNGLPPFSSDALFNWMHLRITFEEILRSNEKGSGRLPLLPPVQQGRNNGSLTMAALKSAVKRFMQPPSMSKEEWERDDQQHQAILKANRERFGDKFFYVGKVDITYEEWQKQNRDSINDCLQNHRVSYRILAALRWERFKNFRLKQQDRGKKLKNQKRAA